MKNRSRYLTWAMTPLALLILGAPQADARTNRKAETVTPHRAVMVVAAGPIAWVYPLDVKEPRRGNRGRKIRPFIRLPW